MNACGQNCQSAFFQKFYTVQQNIKENMIIEMYRVKLFVDNLIYIKKSMIQM